MVVDNYILSEILCFIFANKVGTKAFKDYNILQTIQCLTKALQSGILLIDRNNHNAIQGILVGKTKKAKVLYVNNILVSKQSDGVLIRMLNEFQIRYPEFQIEAERNGKFVKYNTKRLIKLLTLITK